MNLRIFLAFNYWRSENLGTRVGIKFNTGESIQIIFSFCHFHVCRFSTKINLQDAPASTAKTCY